MRDHQTGNESAHGEERFRVLVESIRDYAIFMLDPQGHVLTWNPGAERIKGYRAEEIVGRRFTRFYTAADRERGLPEALLRCAEADGRVEDEGWRVRKDGTRFWASVVITALRDEAGHLSGFAKVTRDLTEPRRAEEERVATARAHEALRLRDEFLSVAAHELRTPLTSLRLDLQILARALSGGPPEVAPRIQRTLRSVARLGDLVAALLDVSRLGAGRLGLRREAVDLGGVAAEVVARFEPEAERAGGAILLDSEAGVEGAWDRFRIEQVITNLVANALRHAPGTPVRVRLRRHGARCVLTVDDDGPGIAASVLPRLFQRFAQGPDARQLGGLGLGLYLARSIVEAHGGTLTAENRPAGGARFAVSLPMAAPELADAAAP
jgi:PAS domain S-box-containing protein